MWNNQKQQKIVFHYVKLTNLQSFQTRFPKSGPTYRGQVETLAVLARENI